MRLWSIHPSYLDRQGLLGLWREGLLAQKVLAGQTNKYKNHPQLDRFKNQKEYSLLLISAYLWEIWEEGQRRKYNFIWQKIWTHKIHLSDWVYNTLTVTNKQLEYEFNHLQNKLWKRNKIKYWHNTIILDSKTIKSHPLFKIVPGKIEQWEKIK